MSPWAGIALLLLHVGVALAPPSPNQTKHAPSLPAEQQQHNAPNTTDLCSLPLLNASVGLGVLEPLRAHFNNAGHHRVGPRPPPCKPGDPGVHEAYLRAVYGLPTAPLPSSFVRRLHGILGPSSRPAPPPSDYAPAPTNVSRWCVAPGQCQASALNAPASSEQNVVVLSVGQLRTFNRTEVHGSHRHFVVDPLRAYGHAVTYVLVRNLLCAHQRAPGTRSRETLATYLPRNVLLQARDITYRSIPTNQTRAVYPPRRRGRGRAHTQGGGGGLDATCE